jgi:glycosyltransferase involved in cell wall biosynthesis
VSDLEPSHFDGGAINPIVIDSFRPIVDSDVPDADVVIATFWRTGPWVAGLSPKKGTKVIFLQGYETSPGHWNPEIDRVWQLPLRKIVVASWLKDLARNRFGDTDAFCVPNSVDTSVFNSPPRSRNPIPTVGFLYSTAPLKGTDICLAALAEVKKNISNLRVIAFGAEQLSKDRTLPSWVEFHYRPPQKELANIYASCDVWLCGSRQEGFHLPPLEAMACRCPVVSTEVGGSLDVIKDGKNGFLVGVDEHEALAQRLLQIVTMDDATWRQMSDAALETATRYTWDNATDLFEGILKRVAQYGTARPN